MEATGRDIAHAGAARIELGGATDVGRHREHNEDAWTVFGVGPGGAWKVAVVADGMGGHNAGEVASAIAIEVIERELSSTGAPEPSGSTETSDSAITDRIDADELARALAGDAALAHGGAEPSSSPPDAQSAEADVESLSGTPDASGPPRPTVPDGASETYVSTQADASSLDAAAPEEAPSQIDVPGVTGDPLGVLVAAIERANRAIWEEGQRDPARAGMGTTVVGAIFAEGRAYLANVGDSPAILVRNGESRQVTRDHGWVAEQVEAGLIDPEDAPYHPYRNILTRCLGTEPHVAVEVYEPPDLLPGDLLVLCSDGVTTHVAVEEVAAAVARATPTAAARLLISLANERGGQDNITVVVARVVSS